MPCAHATAILSILRVYFDALHAALNHKIEYLICKAMEDSNTKSLRFDQNTNEKLQALASRLGLSKRELLLRMVDYFCRTKKDPADVNDELLKNTLVKSHKTYMGFIKAQEDLLLIPMKQSMDKMIANQRDIVKYFNEQVLAANKTLLKNQGNILEAQQETEKLMKLIQDAMEQKLHLKVRFLRILGGYVKAREELGSFKGKEKEELLEQTKRQIERL